ncbi:telomerase protein component 1 isoform X3 [Phaenicophaeus curvirostris]|uniref:telomerase protein component 1 isoform X3 n=1 Tax=Phaenicophaeus curvirostris TaxID=33595 RepID=UPI0037F0D1D7
MEDSPGESQAPPSAEEAPPLEAEPDPEELAELKAELTLAALGAGRGLKDHAKRLGRSDPEGLLQVALFCSRAVGLQAMGSALLALAATLPPCRPLLRRYLPGVVRRPPDWAAVPRLYQRLSGRGGTLAPLPRALRDALALAFRTFDPHQVAKYRGRPGKRKRGRARPLPPPWKCWGRGRKRPPPRPPLPPSLFSLRSLVRRLHIRDPPDTVRALLGRRDAVGGPPPRLPPPPTWERELSKGGAARTPPKVTWERLIGRNQVPLQALVRNLRSLWAAGPSEACLRRVEQRLRDPGAIAGCRLPPSQFLRAYQALCEPVQDPRRRRRSLPTPPPGLLQALSVAALGAARLQPPLPGVTHVLLRRGVQGGAGLLALLLEARAEAAPLRVYGGHVTPPRDRKCLLEAARELEAALQGGADDDVSGSLSDVIWELVESGEEVQTLVVLSPEPELPGALEALTCLRRRQLRPCRFINVTPTPVAEHWDSRSDTMMVAGFNEAVLRLVALGDAGRLVAEVAACPARFGLAPPPPPPPEPPGAAAAAPPPLASEGRVVRLFVSSSLRDMAAEREALVRAALPRLRARAAPRGLRLQEVELRWGLRGPDLQRRVELCLDEVDRCDILVGILGERYGTLAPSPPPRGLPPGRSVTELEIRTFLGRWKEGDPPLPALIYLRDPRLLREVPPHLLEDFGPESPSAASKLSALKDELGGHPALAALRRFSCSWGGSETCDLGGFVDQVVDDVWDLLETRFLQGPPPSVQASFLASQRGCFVARSRLLVATLEALRGGRHPRLLLTGPTGCGRTVFMAALVGSLQAPPPPPKKPLPHPRRPPAAIFHLAGAGAQESDVRVALAHLIQQLRDLRGAEPRGLPGTYRELRNLFWKLLAPPGRRLILLVDDADRLHEGGTPRPHWLPPNLPPHVTAVLSARRPPPGWEGAERLELGPLPPPDRRLLVGAELEGEGRSLGAEQMRQILAKVGARQPLYLKLLLAELRGFARHEDVGSLVASAPPSLSGLLSRILERLQLRHGSALGLVLGALDAAPHGLREGHLVAMMEEGDGAGWELLRDLRWLLEALGSPLQLRLVPALRAACARLRPPGPAPLPLYGHRALYGHRGGEGWEEWRRRGRRELAAAMLREADPRGDGEFVGADPETLRGLAELLAQSGLWSQLWALFCSPGFLRALLTHGHLGVLTHGVGRLREARRRGALVAVGLDELGAALDALVGLAGEAPIGLEEAPIEQRKAPIGQGEAPMGRWALAVGLAQEVANAAPPCPLLPHVERLLPHGPRRLLRCPRPPPDTRFPPSRRVAGARGSVLALSPCGTWGATGGEGGTLTWSHLESGEVVQEIQGTCGSVRAVVALSSELVALGGAGGELELWSLPGGKRLWSVPAHRGPISALSPHPGGVASAALDGVIKALGQRGAGASTWSLAWGGGGGAGGAELLAGGVASGAGGGVAIRLWAWPSGLPLARLPLPPGTPHPPRALAFAPPAPDGDPRHRLWLLAVGPGGRVLLWPGGLGRLRATLSPAPSIGVYGERGHAPSIQVYGERGHAPSIGVNGTSSHAPSIEANGPSSHAPSPLGPALCAAFDASGSHLAVGHGGGGVWVHRVPWGSAPQALPAAPCHVTSLAWAGPEALAGGGASESLFLWAWPASASASGPPLLPLPRPREVPLGRGGVRGVGGAAGSVVVLTGDGSVGLLGLAGGQPPRWLRPHLGPTECVGLSPTGAALGTAGDHSALAVWGVGAAVGLRRRWPQAHSEGVSAVGWAGALLVSGGSGGAVCVWDPESGQRVRRLESPGGAAAALGGDARWVLSVSRDGSVSAWEGAELVSHVGGRGAAGGAIAPPGRRHPLMAVVGPDERTRLWEPLKEPLPTALCSFGGAEAVGVAVGAGPAIGHAPSIEVNGALSHAPSIEDYGERGHAPSIQVYGERGHAPSIQVYGERGHAPSIQVYGERGHAPSIEVNGASGHAPSGSGHAPLVAVAAAADGTVRVIELPPPESPPAPDQGAWRRGPVTSLAWSPAGGHVVSGAAGGALSLWGRAGLEAEAKVAAPPISALLFRTPHEILVAAGRRLELWELRGGRLVPGGALGRLPCPVLQALLPAAPPEPPPGPPRPVLLLTAGGQLWGLQERRLRPLRILRREPLPPSVSFLLGLLGPEKVPEGSEGPPHSQDSGPPPQRRPRGGGGDPLGLAGAARRLRPRLGGGGPARGHPPGAGGGGVAAAVGGASGPAPPPPRPRTLVHGSRAGARRRDVRLSLRRVPLAAARVGRALDPL